MNEAPTKRPTPSDWQMSFARQVGATVKLRRQRLGLSAAKLAERTETTGFPMSRGLITKIENGHRSGLDTAEVIVLAAALRIPPVELLFGQLAGGPIDVFPAARTTCWDALKWFSGEAPLMLTPEGHDPYSVAQNGTEEDLDEYLSEDDSIGGVDYRYLDEPEWAGEGGMSLRLLRKHDFLYARVMDDERELWRIRGLKEVESGAVRPPTTPERQAYLDTLSERIAKSNDELASVRSELEGRGISLPMQMTPGAGFIVEEVNSDHA